MHFVPSPYTPQAVEAVFSAQEQVTIIRWRIDEAPPATDTRFELANGAGYAPVDFSHSVFPGGLAACADGKGTCAQYVVRGPAAIADGDHPVRAVHATYGVLPGEPTTTRTVSTTLDLDSFFHFKNDVVYVNLTDTIASDGPYRFPRPYDRAMWATSGLCVSELPPDGVAFTPLDASGGFPPEQPLTDSGLYCIASRPIPSDGGEAAMVQARVATLPEVETRTHLYDPPIEKAPLIYQIVLDLEIAVPDRCAAAVATIESLVDYTFSMTSVPVRQLPTLNLAQRPGRAPCGQVDNRALSATDLADAVKREVMSFPETHQQFHFLYFNNLEAPLPRSLTDSFHALFDGFAAPAGYSLDMMSWLFSPPAATLSDVKWWKSTPWMAADDPSFAQALTDYARSLPYETQVHDSGKPVALLTTDELPRYAGNLIKICDSSPRVQPVMSVGNPATIRHVSWEIDAASPPAYLVTLQPEIEVPAASFVDRSAVVHYQICTRYCVDHPYLTDADVGVTSWASDALCAGKDY